jgi:hypothetical protein
VEFGRDSILQDHLTVFTRIRKTLPQSQHRCNGISIRRICAIITGLSAEWSKELILQLTALNSSFLIKVLLSVS